MVERDTWDPDVGYWAERWDPDGRFHPLIYTFALDDKWVQATSLPFVYAGVPLWRIGGAGALLALPLAGSLVGAVAARRLARVLGAPRGWTAFWLVGLGTPLLFYAADFWEHGTAVGLAVLAVALALEHRSLAHIAAAGVLFGVSAVLRTEMLVYGGALFATLLAVGEQRAWWFQAPRRIFLAGAAAAVPVVANYFVEQSLMGSSVRATRAGTNVSDAGSELVQRARDGLLTSLALFPDDSLQSFALGAVLLVGLVALGRRLSRGPMRRAATTGERAALLLVPALYLTRFADGLGFVPGMFTAAPAAGTGVGVVDRGAGPETRAVASVALGALPVVWALQWRGQLVPQWGGRYVLLSGVLLTVMTAVTIESRGGGTWSARAPIALAIVVTLFGAAWHVDRSRDVARASEMLLSVPSDVAIVSTIAHLGREAGAFYGDRRWLSTQGASDVSAAMEVARRAGVRAVDLVQLHGAEAPARFPSWRTGGVRYVAFLGFSLSVRRYVSA